MTTKFRSRPLQMDNSGAKNFCVRIICKDSSFSATRYRRGYAVTATLTMNIGNSFSRSAFRCWTQPMVHRNGGCTMLRQHWLDYDPVALAVLVIGLAIVELLALSI